MLLVTCIIKIAAVCRPPCSCLSLLCQCVNALVLVEVAVVVRSQVSVTVLALSSPPLSALSLPPTDFTGTITAAALAIVFASSLPRLQRILYI